MSYVLNSYLLTYDNTLLKKRFEYKFMRIYLTLYFSFTDIFILDTLLFGVSKSREI